jgi:hypothetical protein
MMEPHSTVRPASGGGVMKTFLCIMLLVVSAAITAWANRMLKHWHMMNDMGEGLMMGVVLLLVMVTGCTPIHGGEEPMEVLWVIVIGLAAGWLAGK